LLKKEAVHLGVSLPVGQQQARTHWGTHASGEAFDKKKKPYLTQEAQEELLLSEASNLPRFSLSFESLWVRLHVHQSFFHCVKY
jgi:hypothetical protein